MPDIGFSLQSDLAASLGDALDSAQRTLQCTCPLARKRQNLIAKVHSSVENQCGAILYLGAGGRRTERLIRLDAQPAGLHLDLAGEGVLRLQHPFAEAQFGHFAGPGIDGPPDDPFGRVSGVEFEVLDGTFDALRMGQRQLVRIDRDPGGIGKGDRPTP